jgi:putative Ca2+/H+ antiporter (TMEM165/GDT1 family)
MMVAFGATLANTIMTRLAFFISMNIQYLQPYPLESLSAIILVIIAILYAIRKAKA